MCLNELGDAIYSEGYTIHTTLDIKMQRTLESELAKQLRAIESRGHTLPMIGNANASRLRVRSGLMRVHESPRSSLRYPKASSRRACWRSG